MAVDHYENFPVASILLPRRLVPAVEAIYAFARSADDIADEGDASDGERLAALAAYRAELGRIGSGAAPLTPLFQALAAVVAQYDLSLAPFNDLLSAFEQDIVVKSYAHFDALLDYCRRSANPVGRLMLALYQESTPARLVQADAICSALQLINFLQDVAVDRLKGRIYIPLDDLRRHGVDPAALANWRAGPAWSALMAFEVARARALMQAGAPLALHLPGRIGWELRLVVQGGLRILERIEAASYDVFEQRPVLAWRDWCAIAGRALTMGRRLPIE
ncbi:squalene synthase HpnC [Massilia sp. PWRC2]|uniref:squalene synthase HpnC n=1 Tax=Massilia sp. PWRC2 TaxID=2804626 RepID=UPI003CF48C0A